MGEKWSVSSTLEFISSRIKNFLKTKGRKPLFSTIRSLAPPLLCALLTLAGTVYAENANTKFSINNETLNINDNIGVNIEDRSVSVLGNDYTLSVLGNFEETEVLEPWMSHFSEKTNAKLRKTDIVISANKKNGNAYAFDWGEINKINTNSKSVVINKAFAGDNKLEVNGGGHVVIQSDIKSSTSMMDYTMENVTVKVGGNNYTSADQLMNTFKIPDYVPSVRVALRLSGDYKETLLPYGASVNEFKGGIEVNSTNGQRTSLKVIGDSVYGEEVSVDNSVLTSYLGTHTFNGTLTLNEAGAIIIGNDVMSDTSDGSPTVVFNKNINIGKNSYFMLFGNTNFSDDSKIEFSETGSTVITNAKSFQSDLDLKAGNTLRLVSRQDARSYMLDLDPAIAANHTEAMVNTVKGDVSSLIKKLMVEQNHAHWISEVDGEVEDFREDLDLQGVASKNPNGANHVSKAADGTYELTQQGINSDFKDMEVADVLANNFLYVSFDEVGDPTYLECEVTGNNIGLSIAAGDVLRHKISGEGTIEILANAVSLDSKMSYNGHVIVFDGTDKFNEFGGTTNVKIGTMAIKAGTVFGSGKGTLNVSGESYKEVNGLYEVHSSGILAFYNDSSGNNTSNNDTPKIAEINVETLNLGDESSVYSHYNGGARLWFDASKKTEENGLVRYDTTSERTVAKIAATNMNIKDDTVVWYDHISSLSAKNEKVEGLDLDAGTIKIELDSSDIKIGNESANEQSLQKLFETGMTSVVVKKDDDGYNVFVQRQRVDDFYRKVVTGSNDELKEKWKVGTDEGDKYEQYATALEGNMVTFMNTYNSLNADFQRVNLENLEKDFMFYDTLVNTGDPTKIIQTIQNLSRGFGLENITTSFNHIGNPTSVFFNGVSSSRGGTLRGQEENVPESTPAEPGTAASEVTNSDNNVNQWTAWASFSHTSINAHAYKKGGQWFDGYNMRRTGVLTGMRRQFSDTLSGGFLFAYSSPEQTQSGIYDSNTTLGAGSYSSNIDMEDFQFAIHFEKLLARNWSLSVFLGGGAQWIDWNRNVNIYDRAYTYTGDTSGNTLTATFYFVKHLQFTERFSLAPTIGFDTEHSWVFGFNEVGEAGDVGLLSAHATAYNFDRITHHRETFRIGTSANFNSYNSLFGLTGRIFYGCQLNKQDAAEVSFTSSIFTEGWTIRGNEIGKSSWNLGLGAYRYLNWEKTLSVSVDYNAVMYRNATTQNVTAGLQWRF
ncbi:MAG: autotransporter outer membrane beta-barrel domain-containing protein [Planctomycetia bacterium]|nr:autotransporter outer membrane beta-barrel domain-containing protein [Planctomycetia bacterium]